MRMIARNLPCGHIGGRAAQSKGPSMTAGRPLSIARGAISDPQKAFYGALFGWEVESGTITLGGTPVASCGLPVSAPGWLTVVSSESLDADLDAAVAAGGSVVEGPAGGDAGRSAVLRDNVGAQVVLHEGATLPGLSRTQGHFAWSQLNARDTAAAAAFYGELCGWTTADAVNGSFTYQDFADADGVLAGLMAIDEASGLGVPVMWQAYVEATDVDAIAARVEEQGGRIWVRPTSIEPGRFVVCADPEGDVFAVESMG